MAEPVEAPKQESANSDIPEELHDVLDRAEDVIERAEKLLQEEKYQLWLRLCVLARRGLGWAIVLTIVNIAFIVFGQSLRFPFSAYLPEVIMSATKVSGGSGLSEVDIVLAVVCILLLGTFWLFCLTYRWCMNAALVAFALDTAIVLFVCPYGFVPKCIAVAFHLMLMYQMFNCTKIGFGLYWHRPRFLKGVFAIVLTLGCAFVLCKLTDKVQNTPLAVRVPEFRARFLKSGEAMWTLGEIYRRGTAGVEKDDEKSFEWFLRSANRNFRGGLNGLAQCYENGWGTTKDPKKAYEYYLRAYETGSVFAMNALGDCCEKGIGTETNFVKAIEWWTKAAEKKHGWAACKVAIRHQKDKKDNEAFTWFRKAADIGSDYACCKLGECYERGWGTETNAVEAAKWFIKGAERRHPWGMEKAGDFYATGYGVEKDEAKAREWYEKAVKRNGSKSAAKKIDGMKKSK